MSERRSRVTIHMAASLDGFVARKDGGVEWMETGDEFAGGETLDPAFVAEVLASIDCYVMGSRTYETALAFEARGAGWAYGEKPVVVLTRRSLPRARPTVEFRAGDLREILADLRRRHASLWIVGGGELSGECLRAGLADEVRVSILPVALGDGIPFFRGLDRPIALHLIEVRAYRSGIVALRHDVRR